MKKILIIGCCGSGKSTFARKLHRFTNIELLHLDQHYWKANWIEPKKEEWIDIVQQLVKKPSWIMDGNYSGTMDIRINEADTIFFLDFPTWICFWRVIKRIFKHWGTERPDMPKGCKERFDLEFLHYVATFNIRKRNTLLKKVNRAQKSKRVHIFKNDEAIKTFFKQYDGL